MCLTQQHVSATHMQKKLLEVTLYNCRITTQLDGAKDPSKRYKLITFKPQVLYHIHAIYYIPLQVRHNLWLLTDIRFPIIKLFVFPEKKKNMHCAIRGSPEDHETPVPPDPEGSKTSTKETEKTTREGTKIPLFHPQMRKETHLKP